MAFSESPHWINEEPTNKFSADEAEALLAISDTNIERGILAAIEEPAFQAIAAMLETSTDTSALQTGLRYDLVSIVWEHILGFKE